MSRWIRSFGVQLALVLILTGLASAYDIGSTGLAASEGHRVVPGIEFLERWRAAGTTEDGLSSADVLVPTMYGTPYLRKPPGMPWAIALSMSVFGETEFAARLVSVVSMMLMAGIAAWCGHRWWGLLSEREGGKRFSFGALSCGLAVGLLPTMLSSARAAEIETLHNLMVLCGVVCAVELLYVSRLTGLSLARRSAWAVGLGGSLLAMMLVKGPAGMPVVAGVIGGCVIASRSWKPLRDPLLWVGLGLAGVWIGGWAWLTARAASAYEGPIVTQSVEAFLFEPDRLVEIAILPFAAIGYQFFASLAVLFAISPRSRVDMAANEQPSVRMARVLGWGWVVGVLIYTLSGVSNPRYVLPAASVAGLAAGFVVRGVVVPSFVGPRLWLGRLVVLGSPIVTALVLVGFAVGYVLVEHPRRGEASGRAAGASLGEVLASIDGPVEVWADGAIEARPEVLWEAERVGDRAGKVVEGRWAAEWKEEISVPGSLPGLTRVLLLRNDPGGDELAAAREAGLLDGWREAWTGEAAQFRFWLGVPAGVETDSVGAGE